MRIPFQMKAAHRIARSKDVQQPRQNSLIPLQTRVNISGQHQGLLHLFCRGIKKLLVVFDDIRRVRYWSMFTARNCWVIGQNWVY